MISRAVKFTSPLCVVVFITIRWLDLIELFQAIEWVAVLPWIFGALITFPLLYFVKFFRFYLILSESKIYLSSFMRLYLQTTLVNIIVPFKLGEIFRFYLVGKRLANYKISFLSIITERFLDTCVIVFIMLISIFFIQQPITGSFLFFLFFIFLAFSIYALYPSFSLLMNKIIVFKRARTYDEIFLKFLDILDNWYSYENSLVHKKGGIVFFCSAIAWFIEFFFLYSLAKLLSISFDLSFFNNYISDIFAATPSLPKYFFDLYAVTSIIVLGGAYVLAIMIKILLRSKATNEQADLRSI